MKTTPLRALLRRVAGRVDAAEPRFEQDADVLFRYLLGRRPSREEAVGWARRLTNGETTELHLLQEMLSSAEYVGRCVASVHDIHLFLIHAARVKLVSTVLPPARRIVDLGGANAPVYAMGYPHAFDELVLVDLPPPERCEMYQHIEVKESVAERGRVAVLYTNMTDLSAVESSSVDLVYSGQSIEHVTESDSFLVYAEAKRVLRKGGLFCLDTPNRRITEIHVGGDGWIHPEHKIEYRPEHLRRNLESAGFSIVEQIGVCPMLQTWRRRAFDYRDFLSAGLCGDVESSYIQYYACVADR